LLQHKQLQDLLLLLLLISTFLVWRYLNMGIAVIPAAGGGVTQKVQEFTSTGSFVTPSIVTTVDVLLVGGGGGGGGARVDSSGNGISTSGGGGGGGVVQRTLTVTPGTSYTVTIGAGGAGGVGGTTYAGAVGSNSTFGSLLTARGGGGGSVINDQGAQNSSMQGASGATGGGAGGRSAGGTDTAGGGGGGINSNGMMWWRDYTNPFGASITQFASPGSGSFGGGAGTFAQIGTNRGFSFAGAGYLNFGGGGAGGQWPDTSTVNAYQLTYGATAGGVLWSQTNATANGTNGTANLGNGGGGSVAHNNAGVTRTATGGNGSSGYCTVTYWS
jgi:hypothetical protein